LREKVENDRFPHPPGLDPLKAILAKLDPPLPTAAESPRLRSVHGMVP
jgi:hypothetical protein